MGALLVGKDFFRSVLRGYSLLIRSAALVAFSTGYLRVRVFFAFGLGLGLTAFALALMIILERSGSDWGMSHLKTSSSSICPVGEARKSSG